MPTPDTDAAEWMNVTPEERSYENFPFQFLGGWEPNPDMEPEFASRANDTSTRSVRVWGGSETEDGAPDLNSSPENNVPEGATCFVETRVLDDMQHQQYATTVEEAFEIGREQKAFVENAPHPSFEERHREAVIAALAYETVFLNTPPSGDMGDIIRVDDTTIHEGEHDADYVIEREVAVEISGTLDLDVVLDDQGRLLYVDHDDGIEVQLQGQRDNRCLVLVKETYDAE
jgi:hypothetical protein